MATMCKFGADCRYLVAGKTCKFVHTEADMAMVRERAGMLCMKYAAAAGVAAAARGGAGPAYVAPGAPHGGARSNPRYDLGCMNCYIEQYNKVRGIPFAGELCTKTAPGVHDYCLDAEGKINPYAACPVPGCRKMHLKVQPVGGVFIFKHDCVFGDKCNNMKCPFWHPRDAARNTAALPPSYDGWCLFGNKCRGACTMYHAGDPVEGPSFVKVIDAYKLLDDSPIELWLYVMAKRMENHVKAGKITTDAQRADVRAACILILDKAGLPSDVPAGMDVAGVVAMCVAWFVHVPELGLEYLTPDEVVWLAKCAAEADALKEADEAAVDAVAEAMVDAAVCAAAEAAGLPIPGTNAEMDDVERDLDELYRQLHTVEEAMADAAYIF